MNFFKWIGRFFHKRPQPKKLKIGLALGSGGAKGFAELGAIKAFEENGIEFDVVAGTSIGSIIGAFYADGYTSDNIVNLISGLGLKELLSGVPYNMDMTSVKNVLDREIGYKNIEELKKPFKAIATEIETGEEKVFESGNTAMALCASSCFPPFFKPVFIDGARYVDGAFSNSIPADRVKEMGADYIVGIDLANHEAKPTLLSRLFPTYKGKVKEPWSKGYHNSNVMLHPDLSEYQPTSFKKGQEMYEIGYQHALKFIPKIKQDIEQLNNAKRKK
jgi:NTE family protein